MKTDQLQCSLSRLVTEVSFSLFESGECKSDITVWTSYKFPLVLVYAIHLIKEIMQNSDLEMLPMLYQYPRRTVILLDFLKEFANSEVQFLQNWFQPHRKFMWRHQGPKKNAQHWSKQMQKLLVCMSRLPASLWTCWRLETRETREWECRHSYTTRNSLSHVRCSSAHLGLTQERVFTLPRVA